MDDVFGYQVDEALDTIEALRARWAALGAPANGWLAPRFDAGPRPRHGHPVVLGRGLAARLADLAPDAPLSTLRAVAQPLEGVAVDDSAILDDLDTPADLEGLRARHRGA